MRYLEPIIPVPQTQARCIVCHDPTWRWLRDNGQPYCLGCLRRWAAYRLRYGWTGSPADLAAVETVNIPASLVAPSEADAGGARAVRAYYTPEAVLARIGARAGAEAGDG